MAIRLDLNNQVFQTQWFNLEKEHRNAVLQSCIKLVALEWEDLYRDKGFRWELIYSRRALDGSKLYSLLITKQSKSCGQTERRVSGTSDFTCGSRFHIPMNT